MVRVFMISHLPLFSQGLETLLCREGGVEIVGRESELLIALTKISELAPDAVLLDATLQTDDPASIAARILTVNKDTLVITMSPDDNSISVFRKEQRTVHKIQDLMHAITNGSLRSNSSKTHTQPEAKTQP